MSGASIEAPVLELRGIVKAYGGLRPLRIAALTIGRRERVSVGGIESGVSEVLVNLMTGASLPDSGEVRVFGRTTTEISSGDDWLDSLDRFGIVSPRGVLLEAATLEQNLAMPFTLSIDPVAPEVAERVRDLAAACGIQPAPWLARRASEVPVEIRVRVHLARALALNPAILLVEHPTADVAPASRAQLGADMARVCLDRGVTTLVLTNDDAFARTIAPRNLKLHGATGELRRLGRTWFSR